MGTMSGAIPRSLAIVPISLGHVLLSSLHVLGVLGVSLDLLLHWVEDDTMHELLGMAPLMWAANVFAVLTLPVVRAADVLRLDTVTHHLLSGASFESTHRPVVAVCVFHTDAESLRMEATHFAWLHVLCLFRNGTVTGIGRKDARAQAVGLYGDIRVVGGIGTADGRTR